MTVWIIGIADYACFTDARDLIDTGRLKPKTLKGQSVISSISGGPKVLKSVLKSSSNGCANQPSAIANIVRATPTATTIANEAKPISTAETIRSPTQPRLTAAQVGYYDNGVMMNTSY